MCRNAIQDANLYLYLIKQKHLSYQKKKKKSIKLIKIIQTYVLFCFCSKFFFLRERKREVCTTKNKIGYNKSNCVCKK